MKRKIVTFLLSLGCLGIAALEANGIGPLNPYSLWNRHNRYVTQITVRPYNAFTPIAWGNLVCDGCVPNACAVSQGCLPMAFGMPSFAANGMCYPGGMCGPDGCGVSDLSPYYAPQAQLPPIQTAPPPMGIAPGAPPKFLPGPGPMPAPGYPPAMGGYPQPIFVPMPLPPGYAPPGYPPPGAMPPGYPPGAMPPGYGPPPYAGPMMGPPPQGGYFMGPPPQGGPMMGPGGQPFMGPPPGMGPPPNGQMSFQPRYDNVMQANYSMYPPTYYPYTTPNNGWGQSTPYYWYGR